MFKCTQCWCTWLERNLLVWPGPASDAHGGTVAGDLRTPMVRGLPWTGLGGWAALAMADIQTHQGREQQPRQTGRFPIASALLLCPLLALGLCWLSHVAVTFISVLTERLGPLSCFFHVKWNSCEHFYHLIFSKPAPIPEVFPFSIVLCSSFSCWILIYLSCLVLMPLRILSWFIQWLWVWQLSFPQGPSAFLQRTCDNHMYIASLVTSKSNLDLSIRKWCLGKCLGKVNYSSKLDLVFSICIMSAILFSLQS